MNLHRSGQKPDWAQRPRKRWNEWQKIAAKTGGVVTIGNVFTVIGFVGVLLGLYLITRHMYMAGLITIAAGRLCDLIDGRLAEATQTKSPLGEKLDAGIDKLETVATVVILLISGVVAMWAAVVLFVPQLAIAMLAYGVMQRGKRLHPSKAGKASMALIWMALTGFVLLATLKGSIGLIADVTYILVYILVGLSALTGIWAIPGYYKILRIARS